MNQTAKPDRSQPVSPSANSADTIADPADLQVVSQALAQQLESLRLAGVESLPCVSPVDASELSSAAVPQTTSADAIQDTQNETAMPPTKSKKQAIDALAVIDQEVSKCTRCPELVAERNHTVFGIGNPKARLCFLGEAPGADEDKTGEPFVGRAGKLLTKIIEAMKLTRDDVYILNMLKCRPPANRNPLPAEVANCNGFLMRQFETIQPEFICCLGAVAAKNLLQSELPIGKLRGEFHEWNGIKVLATYHPAYLLRNPPAKAEVWKDMQFLMAEMGIEL